MIGRIRTRCIPTAALLVLTGCMASETGEGILSRSVSREPFATTLEGDTVFLFTLTNPDGIRVRAMTYGGIIMSLETPDREGRMADIVLGHDGLQGYLDTSPYFGAIVGRYGNRIAKARFEIDGEAFTLAANDGVNHLHGGIRGFDKVLWSGEAFTRDDAVGVVLSYVSPDGEEGYPGTLRAQVTYTLTDADELVVDYLATTDRPTPLNLTQHSYFNLAGQGEGDILEHRLMLASDVYTPVDETLIPTGELAPVGGTPFDFRTPHAIGERIDAEDEQIAFGGGYDHNFVLNRTPAGEGVPGVSSLGGNPGLLFRGAEVLEPVSGRTLRIFTTEPGIQFYSGNFLDGSITGKHGSVYGHRTGFCLETQHYPDSPNQSGFPSTVLRPGEEYRSRTVLRFGVEGM